MPLQVTINSALPRLKATQFSRTSPELMTRTSQKLTNIVTEVVLLKILFFTVSHDINIAQVNGHNVNKRIAEIKFHVTERNNICKMCQLVRPLVRLYSAASVLDRTATICKHFTCFHLRTVRHTVSTTSVSALKME
jgi:hypothetical protein